MKFYGSQYAICEYQLLIEVMGTKNCNAVVSKENEKLLPVVVRVLPLEPRVLILVQNKKSC